MLICFQRIMVVNLCQPPFQTTIQCNKLCADGYDVSNLLSEDPALRRRGFKLEYFLRPPMQVTLGFHWQVEVCGVDVELWPAGMDQNAVSRKLEVHTSSEAGADTTQGLFLQVSRCEVREGVQVCFRAPRFRPRALFPHLPPAPSSGAMQSELWSRGLQSLGSVARLRLSIPFSSAGTQLGFKALAVWGLPARSCPPEAMEEFQRAHQHTLALTKPLMPPKLPSCVPTQPSEVTTLATPDETIPEEFLDPLTQELMVLPMVLPSGAVVDLSSLEEYQRREATWGRLPNDPFTGVPFTADSKPLPCPLLKSRIDQMVLRRGGRSGVCGGKEGAAALGPQTSRLVPQAPGLAQTPRQPQGLKGPNRSLTSHTLASCTTSNGATDCHPSSSRTSPHSKQGQNEGLTAAGGGESPVLKRKRGPQAPAPDGDTNTHAEANSMSTPAGNTLQPYKRTRVDQQTHSAGSHEERLSASLDAALSCALQGLPSFTSQRRPQGQAPHTGGDQCALCSVSLTRYPTSPTAYALPCRHLLCRPCLTRKAPPGAGGPQIVCPTCGSAAAASAVTRVHH